MPSSGKLRKGVLISFEGIDGSGKSTQARLLAAHLHKLKFPVVFLREPGGTPVSEAIRKILLSTNHTMASRTELLLFLAARAELVDKVIKPALDAGQVVVTDRFSDSTFAYQIYGRWLPDRFVRTANRFAADAVIPHHTFLVDLDVKAARERLKANKDRMESAELKFHHRVRDGFLAIAAKHTKRITVLDGRQSEEKLLAQVIEITTKVLRRRGFAAS